MGPGREVNWSAASAAADAASEDGRLQAAREVFAGKWDILEVFGGFLAVPDGTMIVQSMTLDGLVGKLRRQEGE